MSGRVTIAEKVQCLTAIPVPPDKEGSIFWVVDISVRNAYYNEAVTFSLDTGDRDWQLVNGNNEYRPVGCGSFRDAASIPPGNSGHVMLYFEVPITLQISDAKIRYRGQEPYSYAELSDGDKVVAYDWNLKKVIGGTKETTPIPQTLEREVEATVEGLFGPEGVDPWVTVVVKYNKYTVPGKTYHIGLLAEFSDGYVLDFGSKEISWPSIPGSDPFNFGKNVEFRDPGFSYVMQTEQLKPISQRRGLKFTVTVK
jgi:hypothetical protein